MIDKDWKDKYFPDTTVNPLSEIVDEKVLLKVYAVNGGSILFHGWVTSEVNLKLNENPDLLCLSLLAALPWKGQLLVSTNLKR